MRAPRSSRLPLVVTAACLAVFAAWLGLQLAARSGHERLRALLAGVDLRASPVTDQRTDFPYERSPWLESIEWLAPHITVDAAALARVADDAAADVGWWLLAETREDDVGAAERALWARGGAERLAVRIAEALVDRGVVHAPSLPITDRYDPRALRLDGDGITHLFLHVAWRLDLDAVAEAAPLRLYPVLREPGGERRVFVEPAALERAKRDPRAFVVSRHHHVRARDDLPRPADAAAAGLYAPLDARTLSDEVAAHAIFGLHAAQVPVRPLEALGARLEDSRSARLVSLVHRWDLVEARLALAAGRSAAVAALHAAHAIHLRRTHDPLLLWTRTDENRLMSEAMGRLRKDPADMASLDRRIAADRRGPAPVAVCNVLAPLGDELLTLLPACGPAPPGEGG